MDLPTPGSLLLLGPFTHYFHLYRSILWQKQKFPNTVIAVLSMESLTLSEIECFFPDLFLISLIPFSAGTRLV